MGSVVVDWSEVDIVLFEFVVFFGKVGGVLCFFNIFIDFSGDKRRFSCLFDKIVYCGDGRCS